MEKPQIITYAEKSTSLSLFDCRWIPCSAKFVALGSKPRGTGVINIYEINDGDVKLVKEVIVQALWLDKWGICGEFFTSNFSTCK
jgi:hypothetical protein